MKPLRVQLAVVKVLAPQSVPARMHSNAKLTANAFAIATRRAGFAEAMV